MSKIGPTLPNFPSDIRLEQRPFSSWAGTVKVPSLYCAYPNSACDVVTLANWAQIGGYKLRPLGKGLGWSPLVMSSSEDCTNVVAVSTDALNSIELLQPDSGRNAVRVGTGVTMDDLLAFLEKHGLGIRNSPASGYATVGGVLSGGGHGASVPTSESSQPGFTFGSFSNLVISLTAVVWNDEKRSFVLETFHRSEPQTKSLLVNLGRIFLTEAVIRVGPNYNLQCISRTDIPAAELYKNPEDAQPTDRTFANFIENSDGVTSIWFVFSNKPWIRIFHEKSERPVETKRIDKPYGYSFSDNVPGFVSSLLSALANRFPGIVPMLGTFQASSASAGLTVSRSSNMWGPSKNLLSYVRPTTLKIITHSYVVITHRTSIQLIVYQYMNFIKNLLAKYKINGKYSLNVGTELRVTGLDFAKDVEIDGAESPSLAPSAPIPSRPNFDVAVWTDAITMAGTRDNEEFGAELEHFMLTSFDPNVAVVRPEWSKGFAYTTSSAWKNLDVLANKIPSLYPEWNEATRILNKYDPHRVFTNELLDVLMPSSLTK